MKRLCTFVFCIVCVVAYSADGYKPLLEKGKEWGCQLYMCSTSDPDIGEICSMENMLLVLGKDTTVNGHSYTTIESFGWPIALLREDVNEQSIYVLPMRNHKPSNSKKEYLFYKFDVNVGDSFEMYNNMDISDEENAEEVGVSMTSNYVVESVSVVDGRKVVVLSSDDEYAILNNTKEIWIEGIGSMAGLLYRSTSRNEQYTPWGIFDLLCVKQDDNLLYKTQVATDLCKGIYKGQSVSPRATCACNPTGDIPMTASSGVNKFFLKMYDNNIIIVYHDGRIYNLLGQLIDTKQMVLTK